MHESRLELRIPTALKARVRERAEELGQSITVYVVRALEAALKR